MTGVCEDGFKSDSPAVS